MDDVIIHSVGLWDLTGMFICEGLQGESLLFQFAIQTHPNTTRGIRFYSWVKVCYN